ncbi:MAG: hypothetical protein JWM11_4572 [Planctomycetaceae bacterium]|nr:hypothetical protein [Planctomycetaceae bacterium]
MGRKGLICQINPIRPIELPLVLFRLSCQRWTIFRLPERRVVLLFTSNKSKIGRALQVFVCSQIAASPAQLKQIKNVRQVEEIANNPLEVSLIARHRSGRASDLKCAVQRDRTCVVSDDGAPL